MQCTKLSGSMSIGPSTVALRFQKGCASDDLGGYGGLITGDAAQQAAWSEAFLANPGLTLGGLHG